jgi:hypothetical protein
MSSLDFCVDLMLQRIPPDLYAALEKTAKEERISIRLLVLSILKRELEVI